MEKAKAEVNSNNSMDRISELPEEILHKILYFLSQKEAVRTSVLSKSWRNIWCTRPNLDFSDDTFKGNKQQFLSLVDSTLLRYRDQRLRVEEFSLRILLGVLDHKYVSLLEKWIRTLAFMGTKKLRLSNRSKHRSGFTDLLSVVFEAESLQDLHVERFTVDRNTIERIVVFKHLRSLCLERVCIDDDVFETIISNCPLIETLDVNKCKSLTTIKVNRLRNLKKFSFLKHRADCSIEIHPPSLETIGISDNIWLHDGGGYFRNLNILRLWGVKSSLEHLSSCKFPSLERLTIFLCDGLMGIKLFIDAPKINNFTYAGADFISSISFATTTSRREWHSFIYICLRDDSSSWLPELNELLKSLSRSKISLNIVKKNFNRPAVRGNGCNEPVAVERFNLRSRVSYLSSILTDVFCICRPRIIGSDFAGKHDKDVTECMWKILMWRESGDKDDELAQLLLRDLEEVRLEAKREGEWRPVFELPSYEVLRLARTPLFRKLSTSLCTRSFIRPTNFNYNIN